MEEQIQNFSWSSFPDQWGSANYKWIDTYIVIKVATMIGGGGGGGIASPRMAKVLHPKKVIDDLKRNLTEDEFDHFIKVACKVNGISSEEIKRRETKNKPVIRIKEIENTIETVLKPKVTIKTISRGDI
jgi:hypothetical protein